VLIGLFAEILSYVLIENEILLLALGKVNFTQHRQKVINNQDLLSYV